MKITVFPNGEIHVGEAIYQCALGRGGVVPFADKKEGDGATPAGSWRIRRLWYRADRVPLPQTNLPVEIIKENDGWCDDPKDSQYNRHVQLPYPASCERLWREDSVYDLIVEIGYNDSPVTPYKGSAIFIHIARDNYPPTDGCIALNQRDLLAIVGHLDTDSSIEIVM